ncbi:Hypothetical protein RAK1035_4100 (plasmid) [Roseovarius sp. AK1035]|nr:Hypothetical protein RAK1035_4100 [Roseovarius sp. AK1035]
MGAPSARRPSCGGFASALAAAAAGFGRFCLCGFRDLRFDICFRLRIGLATATSALFLLCCVLRLRS